MTDTIQPAGSYRVFMSDGTCVDIMIGQTWNTFVQDYIKHGCIIAQNCLIERGNVDRMMKLYQQGEPVPSHDNVIPFPETKGSA